MSISRKLKNASSGAADGGGSGGYVDDVFSTYLYEGNNGTQTIENGVDLAGEGGLVWIKNRDVGSSWANHHLFDTERSPTNSDNMYYLKSNSTSGQSGTNTNTAQDFGGWSSNGFMLGSPFSMGSDALNGSGSDYVSWTFRKAPKFFDVVAYTGNDVSGRAIPHSLGVRPGLVIIKRITSDDVWAVQAMVSDTSWYQLRLDSTNAGSLDNNGWTPRVSDSGNFYVSGSSAVNASTDTYIAYLFAHDDSDESMIKCGSYTGNGNNDGPTIDLGFEPQWLMIRNATGGSDWNILDNMRGIHSGGTNDARLLANDSSAEYNSLEAVQLQPTGFKIDGTTGGQFNTVHEFVYIAIRRPNKPAEEFEPEELFEVNYFGSAGDGKPPAHRTSFPVDMFFWKDVDNFGSDIDCFLFDRLRAMKSKSLKTNSADAEGANYPLPNSWIGFDLMNGVLKNTSSYSYYYAWMFRRAPGHFDVVCYEGSGNAPTIVNHGLGVVPEMIWLKCRNAGSTPWYVYHFGSDPVSPERYHCLLNDSSGRTESSTPWNYTMPTDSVFTVKPSPGTSNLGNDYIAYLFATVPGISKVGSYTGIGVGTGSAQDIDCGFTNGARFVLIKRTDSTGSWMVFDVARGITDSSSPLIELNDNGPKQAGSSIQPFSSGFRVVPTSGLTTVAGAEYIFYAIA